MYNGSTTTRVQCTHAYRSQPFTSILPRLGIKVYPFIDPLKMICLTVYTPAPGISISRECHNS